MPGRGLVRADLKEKVSPYIIIDRKNHSVIFPMKVLQILAVFLLLIFLSACGVKQPKLQKLAPLPEGNICRVAVLPFINDTEYKEGERIFYRVLIAELVRGGNFLVAQEGDVRNIYRQLKIYPNEELDIEELRIIANRLDVQLLVSGNIIEMSGMMVGNRLSIPKFSVKIDVLSETGGFLWSTYHRRTGDDSRKILHFGVINTATELVRMVVQDIIEVWFDEGLKKCSD